jgi:hypothetical protein
MAGMRPLALILGALILTGCTATNPVAPTAIATTLAVVRTPPGEFSYASLYSDGELQSLVQFHSSPGTAVHLTEAVHVEILGTELRYAAVDYQLPEGLKTQVFKHVRVLDGPWRGTEGWVVTQQLRDLGATTSP